VGVYWVLTLCTVWTKVGEWAYFTRYWADKRYFTVPVNNSSKIVRYLFWVRTRRPWASMRWTSAWPSTSTRSHPPTFTAYNWLVSSLLVPTISKSRTTSVMGWLSPFITDYRWQWHWPLNALDFHTCEKYIPLYPRPIF